MIRSCLKRRQAGVKQTIVLLPFAWRWNNARSKIYDSNAPSARLKITHLPSKLHFSAKYSFFGQSLSRGHYQPTYHPPKRVCLIKMPERLLWINVIHWCPHVFIFTDLLRKNSFADCTFISSCWIWKFLPSQSRSWAGKTIINRLSHRQTTLCVRGLI